MSEARTKRPSTPALLLIVGLLSTVASFIGWAQEPIEEPAEAH